MLNFGGLIIEKAFLYLYIGKLPDDAKLDFNKQEVKDLKLVSKSELELLAREDQVEKNSRNLFNKFWNGEIELMAL